ncbi:glycosyltransferase [Methylobacterium sp. Leaf456]|uniref:glycosyltransferase n=1 Tax=Methylobacterium sp. Leaf456 TaxID=1736382 RepID=UPI000ACD600A|nr:glycosyltransferase [Methylobacterium sp. Leaf456]
MCDRANEAGRRPRTVLVTFGTRGDVMPFCVLGRALAERGHAVRLVTTSDYHKSVRGFGLEPVETGEGFEAILKDPRFEPLFRNYFSAGLSTLPLIGHLRRALQDRLTALIETSLAEMRGADIVVFNPFAFFAGPLAQELGIPAVRVMCQPLLPTRTMSASLFGGADRGRIENWLSYESFRLLSLFGRRSFAEVRRRHGIGRGLRALANPLTKDIAGLHHVAAWSPALSSDPGDWPVPALVTGAWQAQPDPQARLGAHIEVFLGAGPPPVYVGFGSMFWGAKRNTEVVLRALELWGGRAILQTGPGGLQPPANLPPNLAHTRHADHALLFPRVAAVVHHGGAGTTAAALRAGRPSVILPLLGDQLFWGRRVAALGAAEEPVPLRQVGPEELAARIARAASDTGMAQAAAEVGRRLADEPGVTIAAERIDGLARQRMRR